MDFKNSELILNISKIIIVLIMFILLITFIVAIQRKPSIGFEELEIEDIGDNMEVIFLNLGKADSIIIRYDNKLLLIDTGQVEHGPLIVKALKDRNIQKIDFLILTHPDKDHIGGATDIIKSMDVDTIIQSPLEKENKLQVILNSTIEKRKIKSIVPDGNYKFSLGIVQIEVFPPEKKSYKKDNDYSLVSLVKHKDLKLLFAGDAEKKRLKEVLKYDLGRVDLYKLPHHGRYNSRSTEMIKALSPRIAVITNTSADAEIIEALELEASNILYTGQGHVRLLSDGERLTIK